MTFDEALKILGIEHYFTSDVLRQSYRQLAMKWHPDVNDSNEAEAKFIQITTAYETLIPYSDREAPLARTADGFLLSELGQGLPSHINSDYCSECDSKGYTTEIHTVPTEEWQPCSSCHKTIYCNHCDNGEFTLRSGRKVECRVCKGTGIFKIVETYK